MSKDTPATFAPTASQLERTHSLGVARDIIGSGRGSIAAAFGGDSLKGSVSDLIDLSEYVRVGDILSHRAEDAYGAVVDTHATYSALDYPEDQQPEETADEWSRRVAQEAAKHGVGGTVIVNVNQLAALDDEQLADVVKQMKTGIKQLPGIVAEHREEKQLAAEEKERLRFEAEQREQAAQAGA